MAPLFEASYSNKESIYTFRFTDSNKYVHLIQQQVDLFPYLSALLTTKDDVSSIKNQIGEYILKPPIRYNLFMIILHSISSEQPYILFNELPEDENVLDLLQLFNYLGVNLFSSPLLRDENLVPSSSTVKHDELKVIEYYQAKNLSETRAIATEFIIALSSKKYDLHNFSTRESVFSLIMIIFSNPNVFSSRFRQHTLTVVKHCCLSLFSEKQQLQLPTIEQIAQNKTIDSWVYLFDNDQPLPENFKNTFTWRGVYKLMKNNDTTNDFSSRSFSSMVDHFKSVQLSYLNSLHQYLKNVEIQIITQPHSHFRPRSSVKTVSQYYSVLTTFCTLMPLMQPRISEDRHNTNLYMSEAESARSGRFNTLPKRPKVDKFKTRFGPKDQKYR